MYVLEKALNIFGSVSYENEHINKFKKNTSFKVIVNDIKYIRRLNSKFHSVTIKKLGMACSYPGTFNSSIYTIINSRNHDFSDN